MVKKLSLLFAAVAVLAFAVPAFASAATGLTEGGKLLPLGTKIVGTNVGKIVTTSAKTGNITCEVVTVTGEVKKNSLAEVEGVGVGEGSASVCSVAGGGSVSITNIVLNRLFTTGGGTGVATLTFKADLPSGVTCSYTASNTPGSYNPAETSEGASTIEFNEAPLTVAPAACGASAKLDGKFKLETDGTSTAVFLM